MFTITPTTTFDQAQAIQKDDIITNTFKTGMVTHVISEKFDTYISFVYCIKPIKKEYLNSQDININSIDLNCEFTEIIYHRIKTY